MTPSLRILLAALLAAAMAWPAPRGAQAAEKPAPDSRAGGLYPNDAGAASIEVSAYPKAHQEAYRVFAAKCAACHSIARPINSQFIELSPQDAAKSRAEEPELFKDPAVSQVESDIWKRYVKRMMAKPGCTVKGNDGKVIWEFLVYDSKARKTGKNGAAWRAERRKLLEGFKKRNPEEYGKLFGGGGSAR